MMLGKDLECADASCQSSVSAAEEIRAEIGSRLQAQTCWREINPTKHPEFRISGPGLNALHWMLCNSSPDPAEGSKPWQSTSRGISQNQYSRFQYLEISFPQSFCSSLRVKKLFCNEVIKIWHKTTEKWWNTLNLESLRGTCNVLR